MISATSAFDHAAETPTVTSDSTQTPPVPTYKNHGHFRHPSSDLNSDVNSDLNIDVNSDVEINTNNRDINEREESERCFSNFPPGSLPISIMMDPVSSSVQSISVCADFIDDDSSVESSHGSNSDVSDLRSTPFQVAPSVKRRLNSVNSPACFVNPRKKLVSKSGTILVRSKAGFFRKSFSEQYWIKYGKHTLLFFKSKEDYREWLSNPILSLEERNNLIHKCIDFERDSLSRNILGYKSTCQYIKRYRGQGKL